MRDASPSPSAAANPQGSPRPANHRRKSCNSRSRFGRPCRPTCYARGSSFRRRIPRGCPTSPIHQGNGIHHDCGLSPEQHSARRKKAGNDCAGRPPAARTYPAPRRDLRFPKHKFSGRNLSNRRASAAPDYRCRDCRRTRRSDFGHDIAGDDVLGVAGGPLRLAFRSAPQRRWAVVGHPSAEGLWPRPHSGLLDPDTSPVRADILIFDCEFDGKRLLVSRVDARWVRTSWPLRVLAFRRVDSAYAVI